MDVIDAAKVRSSVLGEFQFLLTINDYSIHSSFFRELPKLEER